MWKFVTKTKRGDHLGLPDPSTASTPEKAALMSAANKSIIQSVTITPEAKINSRGVKRKREHSNFDPETRAKIAKYATKHGNTRTARHFTKQLAFNVAESTLRYMKTAYIKQKMKDLSEDITELKHKMRGRPLLLGELDKLVKDHVTAVRDGGGIVNYNIVIAAARGFVLNQDKFLLSEFGGPIELNKTWAESFLKRIGFVKRKGTKTARKLPSDFDKVKDECITCLK